MKRKAEKISAREIEHRKNQSFRDKGGVHLVGASAEKVKGGYRILNG